MITFYALFYKKILQPLCRFLHRSKYASIQKQVNFTITRDYDERAYGGLAMLSRSILLENSFMEAGIINTEFPYITPQDSLASALILLESERLNRIVVIDSDCYLVGILDRASVLREFPPPKYLISQKTTVQDKYLALRTSEAIRVNSRETLYDFEHIIRKVKPLRENEFLHYGVKYLLLNNHFLADDLLVLTDEKSRVVGTTSGKEILSYLIKFIDPQSAVLAPGIVFKESFLLGSAITCSANEPLENGLYALTYTSAICILLKRSNRIVGILTRELVNQYVHSLYPELLAYPMDRFMIGIADLNNVVESENALTNLCLHIVEEKEEFLIVKKTSGRKSYRIKNDSNYFVISTKSILNLIASKLISSL